MAPKNITPDQIATTPLSMSYRLDVSGILFDFQTAFKKHSITYLGNDTLRFELRDGDQNWWDAKAKTINERSQIGSKTLFGNDEPVQVSFGLNIEKGAPNTAQWLVLGQLHLAEWTGKDLTGSSPPVEIGLDGERMIITVRFTGADGKNAQKVIYTDLKDIERGHKYDIDIKAVFDPDGNGRLVVTRDNVVIADYSGALGYQGQTKVFWGEGLYRQGAATETIAAQFSDLSVKTASAVTMPPKDVFIAAPKLVVDEVWAVASDGSRMVELSGTAKADTTVTVYNGDTKIGTAKVGADGRFELNAKIPAGAKIELSSIATDSTGRNGLMDKPVSIWVGTGAEIGAKLNAIIAEGNVGKIVLTDTSVLTISSSQFSTIFKHGQDALSKIQGGYSFYETQKITGQSYDRQDFYYDAKGVMTDKLRYKNGEIVYDERFNADGSRDMWSKGTSNINVTKYDKSGFMTSLDQYSLSGKLSFRQLQSKDGSSEVHYYNTTTGKETKYTLKAADGSKVETNLVVANKPYTKETYVYDKAGKMVEQHRYEADGTKIFVQFWNADGSRLIRNFDGVTGRETGFTTYGADGSRVEVTFKTGSATEIARTLTYNAAGKVVAQSTGGTVPERAPDKEPAVPKAGDVSLTVPAPTKPTDAPPVVKPPAETAPSTPTKPVETPPPSPPVETPVVTKPVEPPVVTKPVETPVVTKPVETVPVVTPPTPKPVDTPSPTPSIVYTVDKNSGLRSGYTQTGTDGSKTVVTFTPGQENALLKRLAYDAQGKLVTSETFDGAGKKLMEASYAANGSRTETMLNVQGKDYTKQTQTYDNAGNLLQSTRWNGDKVTTSTTVHDDGMKTVKNYAADGSRTQTEFSKTGALVGQDFFDALGRQVSADIRRADGSRDQKGFDVATGKVAWENVTNADKSRSETVYGIKNQSYSEQTVRYDASGKFVEKTRAYDDHTRAFLEKANPDGTYELHVYDTAGREVVSILRNADKSQDTFAFTYGAGGGSHSDPTSVRQEHYLSNGKKAWTDVTDAWGNHTQTAYGIDAKLTSHEKVTDVFIGGEGRDTFVFGPSSGKDVIRNFATGGAQHDVIEIDNALVDTFEHLTIRQVGSDTVVSFNAADTITLKNVAPGQLTHDHFVFV